MTTDRLAIAYHEAGHAVVAYAVRWYYTDVTVEPSEDFQGSVFFHDEVEDFALNAYLTFLFAGPLAEALFSGAELDLGSDGIDAVKVLSGLTDEDADSRIERANNAAISVLRGVWPAVDQVARVLMERKTLSSLEVEDEILRLYPDGFGCEIDP